MTMKWRWSLFVSESLGTRCTSNCVRLQADGRGSGEVSASTLWLSQL